MPSLTSTTSITTTSTNALPLKATSTPQPPQLSVQPQPSTLNTLRSIYSRAARAFLHRDISPTYSLIADAFTLLPAPPSPHIQSFSQGGTQELYADQRRKWDILRITLEVTVYNLPPDDSATIPAPLRSNAMLSSSSLITALHTRSLQLFTPDGAGRPDTAWLPSQVLVTLVLASLKTDCAVVGRWMIEEWLARRGSVHLAQTGLVEKDGYEKVLEVYCLNVLPLLEEWDYAVEFLEYEGELAPERKQHILKTLKALHAQYLTTSRAPPPPSPSLHPSALSSSSSAPAPNPRSPSPTPSTSSHSTTSTKTAVPLSSRPRNISSSSSSLSSLTPLSSASSSRPPTPGSSSTATSRTVTPAPGTQRPISKYRGHDPQPTANGHANGNGVANGSAHSNGTAHANGRHSPSSLTPPSTLVKTQPMASPLHPTAPSRSRISSPSPLSLLREIIHPWLSRLHLQGLTNTPKWMVFVAVFVVLPVISLVLRVKKGTRLMGPSGGGGMTTRDVRRRLGSGSNVQGGGGGVVGVWRRVWEECVKAVEDTVRMGGKGLV